MQLKIESIELADPAFQPIVERIAHAIQKAGELDIKRKELPRYMTKAQAAEYCGCSFNTFQKYVRAGLRVIQVDGVTRIDKNDVDEFLEQNKK
ncbi:MULTISPECIES: helix-turn-helix domain-containing protein [Enterococcus]|uniref:helix-turn-helix domain-containing protein n=1 Tax=Enterococcus TaxID=1350 RepID=UPI002954BCD6|nr:MULTISPECIES: helix-turn-helix domain-containing protein [Enterococcus]MDV7713215.1 helix-turn-helix domain-containing protein [Enterococcus casseliflavus]MEB5881761.1 helix-turn-helix domain-containing protein [Enterococcus gallinarum]